MNQHLVILRSSRQRRGQALRPPHPKDAHSAVEQVTKALGRPLATKLQLGSPQDPAEREADAVADRVMRSTLPGGGPTQGDLRLQRKCADCEKEDEQLRRQANGDEPDKEEEIQRQAAGDEPDKEEDKLRRQQSEEEPEEEVRTKSADRNGAALAGDTATRIEGARGGGQPLPAGERAFFEPRLGTDLADVRVHAGAEAGELNRRLAARAFTVGRDVFLGSGEYRPGAPGSRRLLAHELAHVLQQRGAGGGTLRRWNVGAAPAPHGWTEVTDADHLARLAQAEAIVERAIADRNCQSYFEDNCTNGQGANALRDAFDNANVYLRNTDDNVFGEGEFGGHNIAFNLRAFRIGRFMMASSLLHEMFHNCDTTGAGTGRAAELSAENAAETCRLHTPWIDTVSPRAAAEGDRVTIRGWNFGPVRGPTDGVEIGGVAANIVRWEFMAGTSSRVEIIAEVPAGAAAGGVVVINNRVRSNRGRLTVT